MSASAGLYFSLMGENSCKLKWDFAQCGNLDVLLSQSTVTLVLRDVHLQTVMIQTAITTFLYDTRTILYGSGQKRMFNSDNCWVRHISSSASDEFLSAIP